MQNPKILIVDDEAVHQETIMDIIEDNGINFTILSAFNGKTALEIAKKEIPDLIISDWEMPVMDGLEFIRNLKADEATADIPVIMCTGVMTSSKNLQTALSAGAVDYIRKPVDAIELISRTNSILQLGNSFKKLKEKNNELEKALAHVKTLRGIIPICAKCKKIRDEKGYWEKVEEYIEKHSEACCSHSICEDCFENLYGNEPWYSSDKFKSP